MLARVRMRGQALIETAICVPLLALTLFATMSGSELYRATSVAEAASSEGARWAAQHAEADERQIAEWTRNSVKGAEEAEVEVEFTELSDQDYTMRVTDHDGALKSADAKNERQGVKVTVRVRAALVGFGDKTMESTHEGIRSTEGVAR